MATCLRETFTRLRSARRSSSRAPGTIPSGTAQRAWPVSIIVAGCSNPAPANRPGPGPSPGSYFDNAGRDDVLSGGVKMIPITTPRGTFRVWTKRVGNNPRIKVLLLHGGPGVTHDIYEVFDSYFPGAGIEYYYYDQLGSFFSDQPDDPSLWDLPRRACSRSSPMWPGAGSELRHSDAGHAVEEWYESSR